MLKENFSKYEPKINEILNGKNQVSLIKKAFESAKTQDEKSELAVIFQQKHLSAKYDVALNEIRKSLSDVQKKLDQEQSPQIKEKLRGLRNELENLQDSLQKELKDLTTEVADQISNLSRIIEAYDVVDQNELTVNESETKSDKKRVHKIARETRKVFKELSSQEFESKAKHVEISLKLQPKETQIMRHFAGIVSDVIRDSGKSVTTD
jgi:hypothetical protein